MKNKPFIDLANFSREKTFRRANNTDKRKFHALALKCLSEVKKELHHEQNFLRTKFNAFESEGETVLETNRIYIKISKANQGVNEVIYWACDGVGNKKGNNFFISLDRIAENPQFFVDKLRILRFCG